jgi:hypothetical protein
VVVVFPDNKAVVDVPGILHILVIILKTSGIVLVRHSVRVFRNLGHKPSQVNQG